MKVKFYGGFMKVNIYKKQIDLNKLREEIHNFEIITNQTAYLIMNVQTYNDIAEQFKEWLPAYTVEEIKMKFPEGMIGVFEGNKIFCDPCLKDGEIEIR